MKYAALWKRVLNEGLFGAEYLDAVADGDPQFAIRVIIKAPIIVDSRPAGDMPPDDWKGFEHVAFPFDLFWLEGHCATMPYGALVTILRRNTGLHHVVFSCVAAKPGRIPTLMGQSSFQLTDKGISAEPPLIRATPAIAPEDESVRREAIRLCVAITYATLDTLTMLSCKNVSLSPRENDTKQVRRAVKRHGGNPDSYKYHVLVVRPPGARSESSPGQELGTMPRHLCRGHYALYGAEFGRGLLFGKYAGRFYVPPTLRGKKSNGEVVKDYLIPVPKEPPTE